MGKKNPRRQPGAGYTRAWGMLHSSNDTTAPRTIKPRSFVECDILPGARLEVLAVERDTVLLRLASGATLRVGLERVREVAP